MSINELVVRGSTSISLHERFTSLRKGGATAQGQSINDDVNNSLYNRNGYDEPSPGPALRGATSVPNYTPSVKMESLRRGGYFRSDVAGRPAPPPPHYERYNPERVSQISISNRYVIVNNILYTNNHLSEYLINTFFDFL